MEDKVKSLYEIINETSKGELKKARESFKKAVRIILCEANRLKINNTYNSQSLRNHFQNTIVVNGNVLNDINNLDTTTGSYKDVFKKIPNNKLTPNVLLVNIFSKIGHKAEKHRNFMSAFVDLNNYSLDKLQKYDFYDTTFNLFSDIPVTTSINKNIESMRDISKGDVYPFAKFNFDSESQAQIMKVIGNNPNLKQKYGQYVQNKNNDLLLGKFIIKLMV